MRSVWVLAALAIGLVSASGCGVSKFSFAEMSIDQTGATSTDNPGGPSSNDGGGSGSSGSGGTSGGAGGAGAGAGGASGAGAGGAGAGGAGAGAGGAGAGAGGAGGASPSPTADCGSNHTKIEANYKCHAGPAGAKMKLHCIFRSEDDDHGECQRHSVEREDDDQDLDLHAVAWFVPGTTADIGKPNCAAEQAGSLLARLNNLQLDNSRGCGRFHFRGKLTVCVLNPLPAKKKDRKKILVKALLDQMALAKGAVTVNSDSARVGGKRVSVDVPGPVVNPAYCIRQPGCSEDKGRDPDNWLQKLGLRDDD